MNREERGARQENILKIFANFAVLAVKITECMFYGGDNLMGKKKMCQGH